MKLVNCVSSCTDIIMLCKESNLTHLILSLFQIIFIPDTSVENWKFWQKPSLFCKIHHHFINKNNWKKNPWKKSEWWAKYWARRLFWKYLLLCYGQKTTIFKANYKKYYVLFFKFPSMKWNHIQIYKTEGVFGLI